MIRSKVSSCHNSPVLPEYAIDAPGTVLLPTAQNVFGILGLGLKWPDDRVNVIGHDDITTEFIAHAVEVVHGPGDE